MPHSTCSPRRSHAGYLSRLHARRALITSSFGYVRTNSGDTATAPMCSRFRCVRYRWQRLWVLARFVRRHHRLLHRPTQSFDNACTKVSCGQWSDEFRVGRNGSAAVSSIPSGQPPALHFDFAFRRACNGHHRRPPRHRSLPHRKTTSRHAAPRRCGSHRAIERPASLRIPTRTLAGPRMAFRL